MKDELESLTCALKIQLLKAALASVVAGGAVAAAAAAAAAAVIEQAASKFPRRTSAAAAYLSTSQKAGKVGFQVFSARAIASTH